MSRTISVAAVAALFGRRLRALRKLRNLTQEQLGERALVSGKSVGQIERGEGNPSLDLIARLAAALGLQPWQLLRFEEEEARGSPAGAARAFAAAEKVTTYLAGRPAHEVERALRLLEVAIGDERG